MIPPAAAPPSVPMPAPFSRVVNGVEQPRKLVIKNISVKYVSADFLFTPVSPIAVFRVCDYRQRCGGGYFPPPTIGAILSLRSRLPSDAANPTSAPAPDLPRPGFHCTVR